MTSFAYIGPAIGGPSNGRQLTSYSKIYSTLHLVQKPAGNITYLFRRDPASRIGVFRYSAHVYGAHWFFLPAGQTLEDFLSRWNPPKDQNHWPAFLKHAINTLQKD